MLCSLTHFPLTKASQQHRIETRVRLHLTNVHQYFKLSLLSNYFCAQSVAHCAMPTRLLVYARCDKHRQRPLRVYHNSEGGPYHSEGDLGNHSVGYCAFTTIPKAVRTIRKAISTTVPKGIDTMYHSEGCLSNFSGRLVACTS